MSRTDHSAAEAIYSSSWRRAPLLAVSLENLETSEAPLEWTGDAPEVQATNVKRRLEWLHSPRGGPSPWPESLARASTARHELCAAKRVRSPGRWWVTTMRVLR